MIPIARPALGESEAAAAHQAIVSGWVTQGPRVKLFEESFAKAVGACCACAVSSCTTALHLALLAVGVKPGDVVITVSHSFIATANSVRYCGAEPVFVDVDPETYNMDPDELLRVFREDCTEKNGGFYYKDIERIAAGESPLKNIYQCADKEAGLGRIAAIMPVHQMGFPCAIDRIVDIARQKRLPVVEDAACAIGSEVALDAGKTWGKIGKPQGDIACFSFHPRKILTTGDGGMITTNNPALDAQCRLLRQHGMSVPDTVRHESHKVIFENYVTTGFNYRMTDIQAAVGIEQLKRLDAMVTERRELAAAYEELLHDTPHLQVLRPADTILPNWQSYPIKLLGGISRNQKEIMQRLLDKGISTRRGIMNAHQEPAYQAAGWSLPKSEHCRDQTILLPLYNGIEEKNLRYIAHTLRDILSGGI
jgi:dTDP-4-amino-4,6-dideoxygalactose transaminase